MKSTKRTVFRSENPPTTATHGNQYDAVIGPFKTLRGANFMAIYGKNNPHCQTVADAERIGKKYNLPTKDLNRASKAK